MILRSNIASLLRFDSSSPTVKLDVSSVNTNYPLAKPKMTATIFFFISLNLFLVDVLVVRALGTLYSSDDDDGNENVKKKPHSFN